MSADHRERARMINTTKWIRADLNPRVERYVRLSVGFAIQDGHEEA